MNVGNLSSTTNLASTASSGLELTVDTAAPQFSSTPVTTAQVEVPYTCQVTATASGGIAVTYQLTQNPAGMTIDSTSGLISWTPTAAETPTAAVTVLATDAAGNTAQQAFTVTVTPHNAPVLTAAGPSLGTTDANVPFTAPPDELHQHRLRHERSPTPGRGPRRHRPDGHVRSGYLGLLARRYDVHGGGHDCQRPGPGACRRRPSLRYTPAGSGAETATITYRAWDTTDAATPGSLVTLSGTGAVGGTTAYSSATDTASLTVTATVDTTVLVPASPVAGRTDFDTAKTISLSSTFINNGTGTTPITVSGTRRGGGIAVTATTGSGTWEYSLDGTTFNSIGTVAEDSALLLPTTASLKYIPASGTTAETATITYLALGRHQRPARNQSRRHHQRRRHGVQLVVRHGLARCGQSEHGPRAHGGHAVAGHHRRQHRQDHRPWRPSSTTAAGTTTITDTTSGAVVGGIAVTGTTGKGTWAYSLDGTTFTSIGTVAADSALLLPASASLRYTPDGSDAETATITYCAWDTTTGTAGSTVDTTTNGGGTAFSTATDTASLSVVAGSLSGYVYFDADGDGQRTSTDPGMAGVTVRLYSENSSGNFVEVSGSPVQTTADGSYTFPDVGAGTYKIEAFPANFVTTGTANVGTVNGTTQGTAVAANELQVQLTGGQSGSQYNFPVTGLEASDISLRLFLASTPPMPQVIAGMYTPAVITLSGNTATYTTGGAAVNVASEASITAGDSPTLVSMTATIKNLSDGGAEQVQADTSGTSISASYADGTLTLTGTADVAAYQQVLQSITYSDTASSPTSPTARSRSSSTTALPTAPW